MTDNAVLAPLTLTHVTLDAFSPYRELVCDAPREHLVYALIGQIRVWADGRFLGTLGGRRSVTEPLAHVLRFPAGQDAEVTLGVEGASADCVVASVGAIGSRATKLPYTHWNDAVFHEVGTGTHVRRVGEVITPPGFVLAVGETFQEAGMVSSWPPHATAGDLALFAEFKTTWQEAFYCVCPAPALAMLQGLYPGNFPVSEVRPITNGEILAMPLGSHSIHSHPSSWTYYFWCFCGSALQKTYNRFSTDIGVYIK